MSKHTQTQGRKGQASSASPTTAPASARPSAGSVPRASTGEAPASCSTIAGGPTPTHQQIAIRAYQLWKSQGEPAGVDRENWLEAERQLRAEAR
jgi:hypothetical protein